MESMNHTPHLETTISPEQVKREAALTVARNITYGIKLGKEEVRSFVGNDGKEHSVVGSGVPSLSAMRAIAQLYVKEAQDVHSHLVSSTKH